MVKLFVEIQEQVSRESNEISISVNANRIIVGIIQNFSTDEKTKTSVFEIKLHFVTLILIWPQSRFTG